MRSRASPNLVTFVLCADFSCTLIVYSLRLSSDLCRLIFVALSARCDCCFAGGWLLIIVIHRLRACFCILVASPRARLVVFACCVVRDLFFRPGNVHLPVCSLSFFKKSLVIRSLAACNCQSPSRHRFQLENSKQLNQSHKLNCTAFFFRNKPLNVKVTNDNLQSMD